MKVIGVDPGNSGAIAVLDTVNKTLEVIDIPTKIVVKNKKNRTDVDTVGLADFLVKHQSAIAIVEQVGAKPTDGTVGAFTFGKSYGAVLGVLAANNIPVTDVSPQAWKRKAGLIGEDKDYSRTKASELFPKCSGLWKYKKNNGRAEAALIALHGIILNGISIDTLAVTVKA